MDGAPSPMQPRYVLSLDGEHPAAALSADSNQQGAESVTLQYLGLTSAWGQGDVLGCGYGADNQTRSSQHPSAVSGKQRHKHLLERQLHTLPEYAHGAWWRGGSVLRRRWGALALAAVGEKSEPMHLSADAAFLPGVASI